MPTYEYACTACGNEFERFESITAKPDKSCPSCKKKKAERKISGGGGFLFKGSGFYVTDYKKGGSAAASKTCEVESGKASSPADCNGPCKANKTESKPAKKSA
ncbi:MAG TPA: FmdB family zinc ribbon protein [Planctomycetota bacterium]|nr:FmdB family zinc ribbon protein [Planctomycetota bacterium]